MNTFYFPNTTDFTPVVATDVQLTQPVSRQDLCAIDNRFYMAWDSNEVLRLAIDTEAESFSITIQAASGNIIDGGCILIGGRPHRPH